MKSDCELPDTTFSVTREHAVRSSSTFCSVFPALYCGPGRTPIHPRLIIRSSDIHAAGCFALEPIPKGTHLLEYEGERITKEEGDLRYEGRPFTYLFGIGKGDVVIDGHGMAMFVNHSCAPNCETDEIEGRIYIIALRNIKAGEEITYDYWLYDGDDDAPCTCGSKKCRGSMYSPADLKKQQARRARRQKELQKQLKKAAKRSAKPKPNGVNSVA
jgi:hypothetical protein